MKKSTLLIIILMLSLILGACSAVDFNSTSASSSAAEGTAVPEGTGTVSRQNATLSEQDQILLGIFKLEETDLAVTAEQATEMLPLFQALVALTDSDTVAQEELTALQNQIKDTLSDEQMSKITAMNLTFQDQMSFMQEKGIQMGFGNPGTSSSTDGSAADGNMQKDFGGGGQMPSGGGQMPSGGGQMPSGGVPGADGGGRMGGGSAGGQAISPEIQSTMQARGSGGGKGGRNNTALYELVIELLEAKIQ